MYRAFGYAHATLSSTLRRVRDAHGQGTVEYVALILLVALVMAGVVAAMNGPFRGFSFRLGEAKSRRFQTAVPEF
jgi:Flp pilus assembly pilin Flp